MGKTDTVVEGINRDSGNYVHIYLQGHAPFTQPWLKRNNSKLNKSHGFCKYRVKGFDGSG